MFYRLNVVELNTPLRERPEDILAWPVILCSAVSQGGALFSGGVTKGLGRYSWPGNVRRNDGARARARER